MLFRLLPGADLSGSGPHPIRSLNSSLLSPHPCGVSHRTVTTGFGPAAGAAPRSRRSPAPAVAAAPGRPSRPELPPDRPCRSAPPRPSGQDRAAGATQTRSDRLERGNRCGRRCAVPRSEAALQGPSMLTGRTGHGVDHGFQCSLVPMGDADLSNGRLGSLGLKGSGCQPSACPRPLPSSVGVGGV